MPLIFRPVRRKTVRHTAMYGSLLVATLCAGSLSAQFTSAVEGTVTDPHGAAVPNATLTLRNTETGNSVTATSTGAGYYRFGSLPSAVFKMGATAAGFKTSELAEFRVQIAETKTMNMALELGAQATIVSVSDRPSLIETSEGRVSAVIEGQKLADLPLVGRNFYSLVVLTPGVTGLPTGGTQAYAQSLVDVFIPEYGVNMNAGGLRSEQNRFTVDSSSVTSMVRGGVVNVTPNAESIQELRVSVNNFSAEGGAGAGASVAAISKSGTNQIHGVASFYHTDNKLQARNEFTSILPVFRKNEWIGSFGGPLIKNRTFGFFAVDGLSSGVATASVQRTVTPEFLALVQTLKPNSLGTSLLKKYPSEVSANRNYQTAGTIAGINCAGLASPSATITTVLGSMPCNLNVTGDADFTVTTPRHGLQWNGRLDHEFSPNDRFFGSVFRNDLHTIGGQFRAAFRAPSDQYTENLGLNWTHIFSPSLLNEAAGSVVRAFGNNGCRDCRVPTITVTNLGGFGNGGPTIFAQNNYEFRDALSWNKGSHSFKTGFNMQKLQSNFNPTLGYQRPNFTFLNVFDFANDDPQTEGNIGFNPITGSPNVPNVAERQQLLAGFAQDNWKILPNLSINFGLRWEFFGKVNEPTGLTNGIFQGGNDFTSRIANGKTDFVKNIYTKPDYNNFGPRFSIAWDPTHKGKTSIRAGAGLFYDVAASQLYGGSHFNPPIWAIASASKATPPFLPLFGLGQSDTDPYNFPRPGNIKTGLDSRNGLISGLADVTWVDAGMKNSYVENWFFGIQQSLGQNWALEGNYVGSGGRKLYGKFNVNRVNGDLLDGRLDRLNPSFGAINYAMAPFTSSYNGGNFSLKKRLGNGLSFDAAYTFGKAIDYLSGFTAGQPVDISNWRSIRGLADFNVAKKLAFSLTYQVPALSHYNTLVRGVAGGWQFGSVTILQSGNPYTVTCGTAFVAVKDATGKVVGNSGCDYNADGVNYDFPNAPLKPLNVSGLSRSSYLTGIFAVSDFPVPSLGQEGNLGRNTYVGPGFANTDISLMKNFAMPWFTGDKGSNLQVRAESFNLFNRVNLGQPVSTLQTTASFGRSVTARAARNIQFGMRFSF